MTIDQKHVKNVSFRQIFERIHVQFEARRQLCGKILAVSNDLDLWEFVCSGIERGKYVMLLIVAESTRSSPGRRGYKMAVSADGELFGSIGGGVMEVALVERGRSELSNISPDAERPRSYAVEQVHRRDVPNSSGMICSGRQTVIFTLLDAGDIDAVGRAAYALRMGDDAYLTITADSFDVGDVAVDIKFTFDTGTAFEYTERLKIVNELYIIGGGHCALALSELMARMDFRITIFDDRPDLNTIEKNRFAHEIRLIESYEQIGELVTPGDNVYVVVMTLGYVSDGIVIRQLIDNDYKYFGVLGSKAKMATMLGELRDEGYSDDRLESLHTPIGIQINSRTPEEIAVSIAAEIIAIKNDQ